MLLRNLGGGVDQSPEMRARLSALGGGRTWIANIKNKKKQAEASRALVGKWGAVGHTHKKNVG